MSSTAAMTRPTTIRTNVDRSEPPNNRPFVRRTLVRYARVMTDPDFAQRTVLGLLREAHPSMLSATAVREQLSDVPRVDEAVAVLVADGVLNRLGDLLGVSRAAIRADQL